MIQVAALMFSLGLIVFSCYAWVLLRLLLPKLSQPISQRVRETLETFREGVVVLDSKQEIAFANQAFCDLAQASSERLMGRSMCELGWGDTGDQRQVQPWQAAISGNQSLRSELKLQDSLGSRKTISTRATPIRNDEGAVLGALATFDDLSTIEAMNVKLRQVMRALRRSRRELRTKNQELEKLATTDPLTGCLNRRAFLDRVEEQLFSAQRYKHPLSCIMVDVDHFKSVNDKYGHAVGDQVLVKVAATLRDLARASDLVSRFGGEEFCILLGHTDLPDAEQAAKRYREAIEALRFDALRITASFGLSSVSLGASSTKNNLEQADQALYVAKETGRNKVVRFDRISASMVTNFGNGPMNPILREKEN